MTTERDSPSTPVGVPSWTVIGAIALSFVVLPAVALWLGAYGGRSSLNVSMLGFGVLTMVPGVLLGLASLFVMLGSS